MKIKITQDKIQKAWSFFFDNQEQEEQNEIQMITIIEKLYPKLHEQIQNDEVKLKDSDLIIINNYCDKNDVEYEEAREMINNMTLQ